jgi:hypothetical protein
MQPFLSRRAKSNWSAGIFGPRVFTIRKNLAGPRMPALQFLELYFAGLPPLRDVAALMLESGMRPREIFRLRREAPALEKDCCR